MGVGHGHAHGVASPGAPVGHAGGRYRMRLAAAFVLTAMFFGVELVAGLISGSLALLSDAGHMGADVVALGAALTATVIATRADSTGRRTFGSYRVEIFASGLAVLIMLGMGVFVLVEAVRRLGSDAPVATGTMLVVGVLGLVINLISLFLLRSGSSESLAVRGAYLEVMADAAGSIGVIVAALLMRLTGTTVWDLVVAVAIAVFIVVRAVLLGRQVLSVLGQHAPEGVDPVAVRTELETIDGVVDVHDLHLWTLTSGMHVGTAHLVVTDEREHPQLLDDARGILAGGYGVEHVTVQIETAGLVECAELGW